MTIFDLAAVVRSKNAGPLWLTMDIMFDDEASYKYLLSSPNFTVEQIGKLYDTAPETVQIIPFPAVKSIKVTLPRKMVSGSLSDDDIYGCQQHMPLSRLELG